MTNALGKRIRNPGLYTELVQVAAVIETWVEHMRGKNNTSPCGDRREE